MQREQVKDILVNHLKENTTLPEDEFSKATDLHSMGVSSLDVMEAVSAATRQIGIKVPRSQLGQVKTLDGLVDVLMTTLSTTR